MRQVWSVSLVTAAFLVASHGQSKPASQSHTATLLVDTDDKCRLVLDGADQDVITPDQSKKLQVAFGEHVLKCTIETAPDLIWRKVIEVKTADQVAALVALKALHIQYDQAVAHRNQAAASPQEKHEPESSAAMQNPVVEKKGSPTLAEAMKFIQDAINSQAASVSYSLTIDDPPRPPKHYFGSNSVSQAKADTEQCTITWKETTVYKGRIPDDERRYILETTVRLRDVVDVGVIPYTKVPDTPKNYTKVPEPYVVWIAIPVQLNHKAHIQSYKSGKLESEKDIYNSHPIIEFSQDHSQMATRVGNAIRYASGLCNSNPASE